MSLKKIKNSKIKKIYFDLKEINSDIKLINFNFMYIIESRSIMIF